MADEKLYRVLRVLLEKSRKGALGWEATNDVNTFIVSFSSYGVSIEMIPRRGEATMYVLSILNDAGDQIEEIREGVFNNVWEDLHELFTLARRRALRVDEGLDAILKELEG